MGRYRFAKIEFYITNVCNLTCNDCNRFNNHNFRGWQRWSDYSSVYQRWSEYIDIDHMVILGGEPLLNPSIIDWVYGLNKIWQRNVQILSNGTRLNHIAGLKDALLRNGNWLGISWHNSQQIDSLRDIMLEFLGPNCKEVHGRENNTFGGDLAFISHDDKIIIPVWIKDQFYASAVRKDFTLHDSDPVTAHSICGFAQNKSYHFINGALYKCGPVALLPEFDRQIGLNITAADRKVLNSYRPLIVEDFSLRGLEFIQSLDQPIDQCRFCPSHLVPRTIYAVSKQQRKMLFQ